MWNAIAKYLALSQHVEIPGVGSFRLESSAAQAGDMLLSAPRQQIVFNRGTALTDRRFYDFLAAETGITEVEAVRKFQDFAYELRQKLQSQPEVRLGSIGSLSRSPLGEISFESSFSSDRYFPDIQLPEVATARDQGAVITDDESNAIEAAAEEATPADRWWLWAVILAVTAVAAIGYYYYMQQR